MTWVATEAPSILLNKAKESNIHAGIYLEFKDVTNYKYIDGKINCWAVYDKCTDPLYDLLER